MDAAQRYQILGRLAEEMPEIPKAGPLPNEVALWIGRVGSFIDALGDAGERMRWSNSTQHLLHVPLRPSAIESMRLTLYSVLGKAEMAAPVGARGAFVPAGNQFDAFAALSKIAENAKKDVFIVDPYLDGAALTDFGVLFPKQVPLRLLAEHRKVGETLVPAALRWAAQFGQDRPIEVRLAQPRALHYRALFIDGSHAWTLTQSLKDFAKRSPGEILATRDMAELKIAAYEEVWKASDRAS